MALPQSKTLRDLTRSRFINHAAGDLSQIDGFGRTAVAECLFLKRIQPDPEAEVPMPVAPHLRILIVEDEFLIALDLEDLLTGFGHQVCGIATTADEAERMARDLKPDLVLTDISLARGSSGIDAARSIRARYDIPSIFLSAHVDARMSADIAGWAMGCLQKPCQPAKLRTTLDRAARDMVRAA
jgi:CheY-like chemotaxis protein